MGAEKNFILIDDLTNPAVSKGIIEGEASFVNNIISSRINLDELERMITVFKTPNMLPSPEENDFIKKYFGRNFVLIEDYSSKYISKLQRYAELIDRKNNSFNEKSFLSYGMFIPTYVEELSSYKKENKDQQYPNHKSLLIGAQTTTTIAEYIGTTKYVFGNNAESLTIDIDEGCLGGAPGFEVMNGLETSFEENTFDTINTNFLLHQLRDKEGKKNSDTKIDDLFKEIYRILKPRGKLIMVEGDLEKVFENQDSSLVNAKINFILNNIGFKNINIKLAKIFSNTDDLTRFIRSSSGNDEIIKNKKININKHFIVITASK